MFGAQNAYAQGGDAESLFIERAALRAANERCQILTADEARALDMGFWLVRTTLIRAEYNLNQIARVGSEAADYAATKPCDDPALLGAAARLADAFLAFSRTPFKEFPGDDRGWTATRTLTDVWAIWQAEPTGTARFGLIYPERARDPMAFADPDKPREPFALAALIALGGDEPAPSTARLVMRDPAIAPSPWLGGLFGDAGYKLPTPPRALSKRHFASQRIMVDAPPYGDNDTQGALFLFDARALASVSELDPREAVEIEFLPSDRNKDAEVKRVKMDVGDFQAAMAFASIPRNALSSAPDPITTAEAGH